MKYTIFDSLYKKIISNNNFAVDNFSQEELIMLFRGLGVLNAQKVSQEFKSGSIDYFRTNFEQYKIHSKYENVDFSSEYLQNTFRTIILDSKNKEELESYLTSFAQIGEDRVKQKEIERLKHNPHLSKRKEPDDSVKREAEMKQVTEIFEYIRSSPDKKAALKYATEKNELLKLCFPFDAEQDTLFGPAWFPALVGINVEDIDRFFASLDQSSRLDILWRGEEPEVLKFINTPQEIKSIYESMILEGGYNELVKIFKAMALGLNEEYMKGVASKEEARIKIDQFTADESLHKKTDDSLVYGEHVETRGSMEFASFDAHLCAITILPGKIEKLLRLTDDFDIYLTHLDIANKCLEVGLTAEDVSLSLFESSDALQNQYHWFTVAKILKYKPTLSQEDWQIFESCVKDERPRLQERDVVDLYKKYSLAEKPVLLEALCSITINNITVAEFEKKLPQEESAANLAGETGDTIDDLI